MDEAGALNEFAGSSWAFIPTNQNYDQSDAVAVNPYLVRGLRHEEPMYHTVLKRPYDSFRIRLRPCQAVTYENVCFVVLG